MIRERVPALSGRLGVFLSICLLSFLVNGVRIAFAPLVDVFIQMGINPATAGLAATAVWSAARSRGCRRATC